MFPPPDSSLLRSPASEYFSLEGELRLSNLGQLELLRVLSERGVPLRTKVRGFSMTPFIRDGDVVTITPLSGRAPRIGDVIAFTRPDTGVWRFIELSRSGS